MVSVLWWRIFVAVCVAAIALALSRAFPLPALALQPQITRDDVAKWLGESWWAGVAAIAATLAVIGAAWTIRVAIDTLRHAEAPVWFAKDLQVGSAPAAGRIDDDAMYNYLELRNEGAGPAFDIKARFRSRLFAAGLPWNATDLQIDNPEDAAGFMTRVVAPGGTLRIFLDWSQQSGMDGQVVLTCRSRFGYRVERRIKVWTEGAPGRRILAARLDLVTPA